MKDQSGSTGIAVDVDDLRHAPAALFPENRHSSHCTGGWMGPRAGLEGTEILAPTVIRSPDRPIGNKSLYRLRYSDT